MIVCLVGASGSGKSTVADALGYDVVQSYTTRPRRYDGEGGHTFITPEQLDWYMAFHEVIAGKQLYGHRYFATREQLVDGVNIYVVDPDGAKQVQDNCDNVLVIYLSCDEQTRLVRLEKRFDENYGNVLYSNVRHEYNTLVTNRLEMDRRIFSTVKCDYVVDAGRGIEDVVVEIRRIIEDSLINS